MRVARRTRGWACGQVSSVQVALHLEDIGQHEGFRVVGWNQDDTRTEALDPKDGGIRTEYSVGAWLMRPDEVGYALSSAPRKRDVGTIKYALMTKGADATAGTAISSNIDAMVAWSKRV